MFRVIISGVADLTDEVEIVVFSSDYHSAIEEQFEGYIDYRAAIEEQFEGSTDFHSSFERQFEGDNDFHSALEGQFDGVVDLHQSSYREIKLAILGRIIFDDIKVDKIETLTRIAEWSLLKPGNDDCYKNVAVEYTHAGSTRKLEIADVYVVSYNECLGVNHRVFKLVLKQAEGISEAEYNDQSPPMNTKGAADDNNTSILLDAVIQLKPPTPKIEGLLRQLDSPNLSAENPVAEIEPRADLVNAPDLDISTAPYKTYNCFGNGIGKQIVANPTGYQVGDSTRETFNAVVRDLGGEKNVRELDSINDPISSDEFQVAIRCGPEDYHFIRLTEDGWYNKSGTTPGVHINEADITADRWYAQYINPYTGTQQISRDIFYDDEIIYFAVKKGWYN